MPTVVKPATIHTLTELERELTAAQRMADAEAIREVLATLVRPARGWLTTGQAAERLGISIPTVKDWVRRGTLKGQPVGSRWYVSAESVEKVIEVRRVIAELDEEGYPSEEEIVELTKKVRRERATKEARRPPTAVAPLGRFTPESTRLLAALGVAKPL